MSVLCCVFLAAVMILVPTRAQFQDTATLPARIPKNLGDACDVRVNDPCYPVPNAICAESYCSCRREFVKASNNTVCLRVVTELDAPCEQINQCKLGSDGGTCRLGKCTCQEDFHYLQHQAECTPSRGLGQSCQEHQCYLTQDKEQHIECNNGVCVCSANYKASEDKQKCNGAEITSVFWLSTIMAFLLARIMA